MSSKRDQEDIYRMRVVASNLVVRQYEEIARMRPVVDAAMALVFNDDGAPTIGWRGDGPSSRDEFYCEMCLAHHLDCNEIPHTELCLIGNLIKACRKYEKEGQ